MNKEKLRMASVKVILPSIIARATGGQREVQISASTLGEALNKIVEKYGEALKEKVFDSENTPQPLLNFYVNGKNARFTGFLETALNDGDQVTILPSVSGG